MVSVKILSRYQGPPPPPDTEDGDRSIPTPGPLYQESEIAQALEASLAFGSRKCRQDWQDLMETLEAQEPSIDFPVFLLDAIKHGDWKEAVWCQNSSDAWFASDVYTYEFKYERPLGRSWQEFSVTYYLKFSIAATGVVVYMISCHPSR